jgi:hypothetical protein
MKSKSIRLALVSAFVLASPLVTFAGGQPAKVRTLSKAEVQDRTGISRAIQQGKGAGVSRNEVVLRVNAERVQTAGESATLKPAPARANWGDSAFNK